MATSPLKSNLLPRPPVVAVMGHVDHGKTTLIDFIRKTNVAGGEAGGITQSIGAYEITHGEKKITFIDTPGHEAFTRMRSRGAAAADLAILVVAADEGVKPQTEEAIRILGETKTPFVVAITKIDKEGADLNRTKNDLTGKGVLLEGYGGQISCQPVSGKTGEGVDELLDLLALAAELEELSYDPGAPCSGFVLESRKDPKRGMEVSVVITNGTLKRGAKISTPSASGKVKMLENFLGKPVEELAPSAPALIIGFENLPKVGEEFSAGESSSAPAAAAKPAARKIPAPPETPEETMNLILKAFDMGSLEALEEIVSGTFGDDHVAIVDASVGNIHDSDIKNAIASKAFVLGFKSKVDSGAKNLAEIRKVQIFTSNIIYDIAKYIEDTLKKRKKVVEGDLEILAVFNQSGMPKQIVGGKVVQGVFKNKSSFEIIKNGQPAAAGKVINLQRNKKDADEAAKDQETGLLINSDFAVKPGDHLVTYQDEA